MYQLFVGKPPFRGATDYLTFQKILKRDMEYPAGFPEDARELIETILVCIPSAFSPLSADKVGSRRHIPTDGFGPEIPPLLLVYRLVMHMDHPRSAHVHRYNEARHHPSQH